MISNWENRLNNTKHKTSIKKKVKGNLNKANKQARWAKEGKTLFQVDAHDVRKLTFWPVIEPERMLFSSRCKGCIAEPHRDKQPLALTLTWTFQLSSCAYFWTVQRSCGGQKEPKQEQGHRANSTQKGLRPESNELPCRFGIHTNCCATVSPNLMINSA